MSNSRGQKNKKSQRDQNMSQRESKESKRDSKGSPKDQTKKHDDTESTHRESAAQRARTDTKPTRRPREHAPTQKKCFYLLLQNVMKNGLRINL